MIEQEIEVDLCHLEAAEEVAAEEGDQELIRDQEELGLKWEILKAYV